MSMQDDLLGKLEEEGHGDVIDLTDPANKEMLEKLDGMLDKNVLMISSLQTVALPDKSWEPLLQHASFMLALEVRTRSTQVSLIMDARGKLTIKVQRGGVELQKLEIDIEGDIQGYPYEFVGE